MSEEEEKKKVKAIQNEKCNALQRALEEYAEAVAAVQDAANTAAPDPASSAAQQLGNEEKPEYSAPGQVPAPTPTAEVTAAPAVPPASAPAAPAVLESTVHEKEIKVRTAYSEFTKATDLGHMISFSEAAEELSDGVYGMEEREFQKKTEIVRFFHQLSKAELKKIDVTVDPEQRITATQEETKYFLPTRRELNMRATALIPWTHMSHVEKPKVGRAEEESTECVDT